ncbi:MAG: phospholipase [Thermoanaerobaculia bacterium]
MTAPAESPGSPPPAPGSEPAVSPEIRVVATPTHGRFLLRRPTTGRPAELLLIGFHGYRENATRHFAELEKIPGAESWALVAVDALHAFYAGSSGEVIRGWMTRELRQETIDDNVAYVRRILDSVRPAIGWKVPLAFLGFSQGASMAWRAALLAGHGGARPNSVVALAGDIPPELGARPGAGDTVFPTRVLLAHGDRDEWYTAQKLEADVQLLQGKGVVPQTQTFAGAHQWTDAFRETAGEFLRGSAL